MILSLSSLSQRVPYQRFHCTIYNHYVVGELSLFQGLVVLLHTSLNGLLVVVLAVLLHMFGQLAQSLSEVGGEDVQLLERLHTSPVEKSIFIWQ